MTDAEIAELEAAARIFMVCIQHHNVSTLFSQHLKNSKYVTNVL